MPSPRRIEKLETLIKEELAGIIDREYEFPAGMLVTITRAVISSDARYATAYISVFGGDPATALEILKKNVYAIQQFLNRRLRIRPVPKIRFTIDEEELKREGVEKSLAELKQEEKL